jgi:polyhydroxyalkanoate synthase
MTVSQPPLPQLPDPTVVAEALTTLMQNAAAAVRTTMVQAATPRRCHDPTTLTRAVVDSTRR